MNYVASPQPQGGCKPPSPGKPRNIASGKNNAWEGKGIPAFPGNICDWLGAINFSYVRLSSDSGKQVKKGLCIVFTKPAREDAKGSLAPSQEHFPCTSKKQQKLQHDFTSSWNSPDSFPVTLGANVCVATEDSGNFNKMQFTFRTQFALMQLPNPPDVRNNGRKDFSCFFSPPVMSEQSDYVHLASAEWEVWTEKWASPG